MYLNMKVVVLCIVFATATWAFPSGPQDEAQFANMYMDTSVEGFSMDFNPRIINGAEATPHSIPYQAYLMVSKNTGSRQLCGGSLISPKHVLTAAHCLVNGVTAQVLLGAHDLQKAESSKVLISAQKIIPHENYNASDISNDVGIIVFEEPVELNEYIDIIALPSRSVATTYEGVNAMVSGWGRVAGDGATSPVLREVNSTVITNTKCKKYFSTVKDSQLCISGDDGVGSCRGDSGGPLVYQNVQIGVVSYGAKGCTYGYPSGFSRLTSFMDWIEENTGLTF